VGPGGGRPAKSLGRPARFYVDLARDFVHMCLHEKGKAKAVEAAPHGRPAMWIGRSATTW
jgi:hypothetical protein